MAIVLFAAGGAVEAGAEHVNPEPKDKQHEYSWRLGPQCQLDFPSGGHWFNLGPTGARAMIAITEPRVFIVKYVFPKSPASGRLNVGDKIIGVNGKKFKETEVFYTGYYGPRMELGKAIEESEGDPKLKGRLTFMVVRDGSSMEIVIQLRQLGYFGKNFPYDCKKSEILVKDACEFLVKHKAQGPDGSFPGHWHTQVACTLALMAQGDTYMSLLKAHYKAQAAKDTTTGDGWNWCTALRVIELAEWYLLTKDKDVLPMLKQQEKILCDTQAPNGGFQHGPYKKDAYSIMAFPTALAGIGWALMKQGGLAISEEHYQKARNALMWSTQPDGEIGYGIGMYEKSEMPTSYKPPQKTFSPEDGRTTTSRGGGATSAASVMHYLDPMDPFSESYYKRGIIHMATCSDLMMDGHASASLHAQWGWIAGGLGTVVGDMQSYRAMMDYYKYWFNVNRCYDGSFYFTPCIDAQVDPFSDIRYHITGSAILALSVPKHSLAILGRDPLIPGMDKSRLSPGALRVYDMIKADNIKGALQNLSSLKQSAKSGELAALELLEVNVMKRVLSGAGTLEALSVSKDMFKLQEQLNVIDKKYKGIAVYDEKTAPLRTALAAPESQKLIEVGKSYYQSIAPENEVSPRPGSRKAPLVQKTKGQILQKAKEFVDAFRDTPYGSMAKDHIKGLIAELNGTLSEIVALKKEGDIYLAAMRLSTADKEYGQFSLYTEKVRPLREELNAPENQEQMKVGKVYYGLADYANKHPGPNALKRLASFAATCPDTFYGKKAQQRAAGGIPAE